MEQYMQQVMRGVAMKMDITATRSISDEVLESLLAPAIVRFDLGRRAQLDRLYTQVAQGNLRITDLPPNVVDLVLQAGIAASPTNVFNSFVYQRLYLNKTNTTGGTDPNDPYATLGYPSILTALTSTQHGDSLMQMIERAADPQWFRPVDAGTVLRQVAANDVGLPILNRYLNDTKWFSLWNATLSQTEWGNTLQTTLALHSWPSIIDSLASFFSIQPVAPAVRRSIDAGLASARANAAWIDLHYANMSSYLTSYAWRRG